MVVTETMTDLGFIQEFCSQYQAFSVWLWVSPLPFAVLYYVFKRKEGWDVMADMMVLFVCFACLLNLAVLLL